MHKDTSMIRILSWDINGNLSTNTPLSACDKLLSSPHSLFWVDIFDAPYEEVQPILCDIFHFHPLAIEDALEETHVPKINDWGEYIYLVAQTLDEKSLSSEQFSLQEVDLFLGPNYLVSFHQTACTTIDVIWERIQKMPRFFEQGSLHLLYLLYDEIANSFFKLTDQVVVQLSEIEDDLFSNPDQSMLPIVFSLKRDILQLRQSISFQRDVINKLTRGDFPLVPKEATFYFRDVYDHFIRLFEIVESLQDLTINTLEIFLSVVNNRMNSIMKTLTIITTLFMPVSFLTGFFGMNFFKPIMDFGEWTGQLVFLVVLLAVLLFPLFMLVYFFRKGWMR